MNIPLLKQVRERIVNDPDHFSMEHGIEVSDCGTVCCIAGWAVLLADPDTQKLVDRVLLAWKEEDWRYLDTSNDLSYLPDDGCELAWFGSQGIGQKAQTLLGLNAAQAQALFYRPADRAEALQAIDDLIAAGAAEIKVLYDALTDPADPNHA
jgi:hypothetical protein